LRPLKAGDLDAVVRIDAAITGRARRGFYEKRLKAALAAPDDFAAVAAVNGGRLAGYALARIQEGEFGDQRRLAILDAIGVDPAAQGGGVGRRLLAGLETALKKRGADELRTQAEWSDHALVRFFAGAGFSLVPAHALERQVDAAVDF
jgi:GNAT superfamily N-acetyltransferase